MYGLTAILPNDLVGEQSLNSGLRKSGRRSNKLKTNQTARAHQGEHETHKKKMKNEKYTPVALRPGTIGSDTWGKG